MSSSGDCKYDATFPRRAQAAQQRAKRVDELIGRSRVEPFRMRRARWTYARPAAEDAQNGNARLDATSRWKSRTRGSERSQSEVLGVRVRCGKGRISRPDRAL